MGLTAANKARSVLRMVKRHFPKIDKDNFNILYKTYVRPHMEFFIQALHPSMVKDIQILEKVWLRATKWVWVKGFKNMNYTERLKLLNLTILEKRRKRGDLIETYNIITEKQDIESESFFTVTDKVYDLRGHQLRLYKQPCRIYERTFLLSELLTTRIFLRHGGTLQCFQEQTE